MFTRPPFTLTDGNLKPLKSLSRLRSINDLVPRRKIEPRLLCAGRFAYLDLQPWAKKQARAKDPTFAEAFEGFHLTLASLCDMATRNTLDQFTGTSWTPRPPGVHPDGDVNPDMKPYVFESVVVKIEMTVRVLLNKLKRCFDDLNTMRDSETRFGRRIYAQMTGLHDEIKALFDLYYQHRPSDQEYQRVAENLSEVNRQLRGVSALAEQARDLMTKAEDNRQATETMLAEARATHEQTLQVAADLGNQFDKAMAYNQEVMASLQTMFNTVLDAKDSFMSQPTQTAASDSNVAEMLKLLTLLAKEEGKS